MLRDCISLRKGSTVEDLYTVLLHYPIQLLTGDFVRAEVRESFCKCIVKFCLCILKLKPFDYKGHTLSIPFNCFKASLSPFRLIHVED